MGTGSSIVLCGSSTNNNVTQPAPPQQSLYCHHCRGVISSGPSAFLAGQGRFGLNGAGLAECPRCRGSFVEVLTELERRRIQVASPLRQVRVAATNIMPGRRVTANDIVYTFFLFDTDVQRHVADLVRDSDLDAAISQSLDEAAASPQKATSKRFLESIRKEDSYVGRSDVEKQGCCPVCDEKLRHDESILRLPCAHVFHHDCLMPWLGTHNTCPICRTELPAEEEREDASQRDGMESRSSDGERRRPSDTRSDDGSRNDSSHLETPRSWQSGSGMQRSTPATLAARMQRNAAPTVMRSVDVIYGIEPLAIDASGRHAYAHGGQWHVDAGEGGRLRSSGSLRRHAADRSASADASTSTGDSAQHHHHHHELNTDHPPPSASNNAVGTSPGVCDDAQLGDEPSGDTASHDAGLSASEALPAASAAEEDAQPEDSQRERDQHSHRVQASEDEDEGARCDEQGACAEDGESSKNESNVDGLEAAAAVDKEPAALITAADSILQTSADVSGPGVASSVS